MEQHRLVLFLQKLERASEERDIVAVNRAVVTQPEFLENNAGDEKILDSFLDLVREMERAPAGDCLDEAPGLFVQMRVGRIGHDVVKVGGDRADVLRDRPLVVVQDDDEALGLRLNVVQRLVADAAGEGGVARHHDDVLIPA